MLLSHQAAWLVSRPRTCTPARAGARTGDLQQPSEAAARCTKLLAGTSVFVVGDNSKANAALASSLAALLARFPPIPASQRRFAPLSTSAPALRRNLAQKGRQLLMRLQVVRPLHQKPPTKVQMAKAWTPTLRCKQ